MPIQASEKRQRLLAELDSRARQRSQAHCTVQYNLAHQGHFSHSTRWYCPSDHVLSGRFESEDNLYSYVVGVPGRFQKHS